MKIGFNRLVTETFLRIDGARELLKTLDEGLPVLEERAQRELQERAAREDWDPSEYDVERDLLNHQAHPWRRTFATYSVIVLLHSILETQLQALGQHIGEKRCASLRVEHMAGKGVDRSANYLERVLLIQVRKDPAWGRLQDLGLLRNSIVHNGGRIAKVGDSVSGILGRYQTALGLQVLDGHSDQLWVSMRLCGAFAEDIDGLFQRMFKLCGLPDRIGRIH